jgi:hypothetical protein
MWKRRELSGRRRACRGTDTSYVCRRRTNFPCILEISRRTEVEKNNKWPHFNTEISLKKVFTVRNVTEQRNFGTFVYRIKCRSK